MRQPLFPEHRALHALARRLSLACNRVIPPEAVLDDVEELLLGVYAELGVDGPAVGVGGVAGDVELGVDEADVTAAGEQGEDHGLSRRETVVCCDLSAQAFFSK